MSAADQDGAPEDWPVRTLGEFAKSKGGVAFPKHAQGLDEGDYPFFKVSDMNLAGNEKFMRASTNWVTKEVARDLKATPFPAGAIIFPKIGAALRTNKKRLLVRESLVDNNVMAVVITNEALCLPEFLYNWFLTLDLNRVANVGTVPSLTSSRLEELNIALPPLDEQRAIVADLDCIQRSLEQQEKIVGLAVELRKSLLDELFVQGVGGEDLVDTPLGSIPRKWNVLPLGEVLAEEPKNGLYKHSGAYGRGTNILRIDDFSNDGDVVTEAVQRVETTSAEEAAYALSEDDIVTNRVNSLSHLGKTAIIGDLAEPMVFESNMMRFRVDAARLLPRYAYRVLNAPICKRQILARAKRAVAQASINQGDLKSILVPVPPVDAQRAIVRILDTVEKKREMQQRRRDCVRDLNQTFVASLTSGQLRVANDGVGSDPPRPEDVVLATD